MAGARRLVLHATFAECGNAPGSVCASTACACVRAMRASSACTRAQAKDGAFKNVCMLDISRAYKARSIYIYTHIYINILYIYMCVCARDHQLTRGTRRSRKRIRGLVEMS